MSRSAWWRRGYARVLRLDDPSGEVGEELSFHLDMKAADLEAEGMEPDEARAEALRLFGHYGTIRQRCEAIAVEAARKRGMREAWSSLGGDLSYAVRSLRHTPILSATAVLTLAVGIGATTAAWSVTDDLLFQLPVTEPDRVVQIMEAREGFGVGHNAPRNVEDWMERATSFDRIGAFYSDLRSPVILEREAHREVLPALFASSDLLPILGVEPVLGRGFRAEEDALGSDPVTIISHSFWTTELGADPDVLGRSLRLAVRHNPNLPAEMRPEGYEPGYPAREFTIVGVLPPGFELPPLDDGNGAAHGALGRSESLPSGLFVERPELLVSWGAFTVQRDRRGFPQVRVLATLAPGVTVERASREMDALVEQVGDGSFTVVLKRLDELQRNVYGSAVATLAVGALLVLLTASGNVAVLLLARGERRERECALRACLGAGRLRLARQLLAEAGVLAVAGGVAGVMVAWSGVAALTAFSPTPSGFGQGSLLDTRVLVGAAVLTMTALLVAGLLPAVLGARPDLNRVVSSGFSTASRSRRGWLRWISGTQLALSTTLVLGAALLLRSFLHISSLEPGFEPDEILTVQLELLPRDVTSYPTYAAGRTLMDDIVARIEAIPTVSAVVQASGPLGGPPGWVIEHSSPGVPGEPDITISGVRRQVVAPGFFELLGIPLVAGRTFESADLSALFGGAATTIVNESMTRRLGWENDAVGRQIRWGPPNSGEPLRTIVGVVADVRLPDVDAAVANQVYDVWPGGFAGGGPAHLFIETTSDVDGQVAAILSAIRSVDPSEPRIVEAQTLRGILRNALAPRRYQVLLAALLAGSAILLALTGLFGVMSHAVARRTRETGVRIALGADRGDVSGQVVVEAARLAALAVTVGLLGAWVLGRLIESELVGVTPLDPMTNVLAAVAMVAASVIAAYVPARRAASLDPVEALRRE